MIYGLFTLFRDKDATTGIYDETEWSLEARDYAQSLLLFWICWSDILFLFFVVFVSFLGDNTDDFVLY